MGRRMLRYLGNNALGALALFVALGGVSYAASGGFTSGGQLKACVSESGSMTLLRSGKHCKGAQKQVAWNQVGPAGPKGATGAAGTAGATGTSGPSGAAGTAGTPAVSLWARVSSTGSLLAGKGVVSANGNDPYEVHFNTNIRSCGATGSVNLGSFGVVFATPITTEPNTMFVAVTNEKGLSPNEFTIMVAC